MSLLGMVNKKSLSLITLLFCLNLFLGLLFINEGLFHYDSVLSARAIENIFKTGVFTFLPGRYGFAAIAGILHVPFFLAGKSADLTIRFSGVLFQALSAAMLFVFLEELLESRVLAFFTTAIFSFTPFYFLGNTYGKEHGMAMFFLILSFYLVYRGAARKSAWELSLSSLVFFISVSVRESMLVFAPIFFLLYLFPGMPNISIIRERLRPRLVFSLVLPFVIVLLLLFFSYLRGLLWSEVVNKDSAYIYYLGFFSYNLPVALGELFLSVPRLIFIFAFIGFFILYRDKKFFLTLFLLLWFMLLFYFANLSIYIVRYLDAVMIPVYIFCSFVLYAIYRKSKIVSILVLLYFIFSMFIFMYPMLKFRHRFNGEKRFALYVRESTPKNALVIAADEWPFISYYGQRQVLLPPLYSNEKMEDFIKTVRDCLKGGQPIYMIKSTLSYDNNDQIKDALNNNFMVESVGWFLNEDYHRPEMGFNLFIERLFRLSLKKG